MQLKNNSRVLEKNQIIVLNDFQLKGNRSKVFKAIDCFEDSPIYEEMIEAYEIALEEARKLAEPRAVLYIEKNERNHHIKELQDCEQIIYNCLTVGEAIPRAITKKFEQGQYLEGMVLDAIADYFTFEIFEQMYEVIYQYLKENNMGIIRLSPGERGFEMKHHRLLREKLKMVDTIGVDLSDSDMLKPVKSTSSIFVVDSSIKLTKELHECKKCPNLTCKWRQEAYES